MDEKELKKAVKLYTAMYGDALKKRGMSDCKARAQQYSERLSAMYRSEEYEQFNKYPTMDMKKIYAVVTMCLVLREEQLSNEEIIDFVNLVFRKMKLAFKTLEKVIDSLPCAYRIAEKWNINDHAGRVKDGSVGYELFKVEDGRIEYSINKCMYVEIFKFYGIRELCKVFCISDVQGYANLTKHVDFLRYSDLSDGDSCHDVISRK